MKTKTLATRGLEVFALAMIGEGIVGLLHPQRYSLFWKVGPTWLRETAETLAEHREATRLMCLAEIGLGLWIALREIEDHNFMKSADLEADGKPVSSNTTLNPRGAARLSHSNAWSLPSTP